MSATFIVGNNAHHTGMMLPVVRVLMDRGAAVRVLSLSTFRGSPSPGVDFRVTGARFFEIVPFRTRSSPNVGAQLGTKSRDPTRRLLRGILWHAGMRPRLRSLMLSLPDVVVLPHDAAFPYDRIARWLHRKGVPFVLMQEGVRFPMPIDTDEVAYGKGGAAAIAAWGESSAEHFRSIGVSRATVFATGCPRFDTLSPERFREDGTRLRRELALAGRTLLYLSNPIEMQGYADIAGKLGVFARFLEGIRPLFAEQQFRLLVKLHPREDVDAFRRAARTAGLADRVVVPDRISLFAAFQIAAASVVLTSTVGLEGLLFGVPLGVLELPGTGFGFDYVSQGVGLPLTWAEPMVPQVQRLMTTWADESSSRRRPYLERSLANRGGAAVAVADLVTRVALGERMEAA